jgi:hypothetical protein
MPPLLRSFPFDSFDYTWSINIFGIRNTWPKIESWKEEKKVSNTEEGNAVLNQKT